MDKEKEGLRMGGKLVATVKWQYPACQPNEEGGWGEN